MGTQVFSIEKSETGLYNSHKDIKPLLIRYDDVFNCKFGDKNSLCQNSKLHVPPIPTHCGVQMALLGQLLRLQAPLTEGVQTCLYPQDVRHNLF